MGIHYTTEIGGIDWHALKAELAADDFDNGRTPEQLRCSAENSAINIFVLDGERVIGTVRVLSDGVCNAYVVDVWTQSAWRRQGIGRHMMELALAQLPGQHVYLFTDSHPSFYQGLGFAPQPIGMGRVVGEWLVNQPA